MRRCGPFLSRVWMGLIIVSAALVSGGAGADDAADEVAGILQLEAQAQKALSDKQVLRAAELYQAAGARATQFAGLYPDSALRPLAETLAGRYEARLLAVLGQLPVQGASLDEIARARPDLAVDARSRLRHLDVVRLPETVGQGGRHPPLPRLQVAPGSVQGRGTSPERARPASAARMGVGTAAGTTGIVAITYQKMYADFNQVLAKGKVPDASFRAFVKGWIENGLDRAPLEKLCLKAFGTGATTTTIRASDTLVMGGTAGALPAEAALSKAVMDAIADAPGFGWSPDFVAEVAKRLVHDRGQKGALEPLSTLTERLPDGEARIHALAIVGDLHLREGDAKRSTEILTKALKSSPRRFFALQGFEVPPALRLSQLLIKARDTASATELVRTGLEAGMPRDLALELARCYDAAGFAPEAVARLYRRYVETVRSHHLDAVAARRLHRLYVDMKDTKGQASVVSVVHRTMKYEPKLGLTLARMHWDAGRLDEAAGALQDYAKRFPNGRPADVKELRIALGNAFFLQSKWEKVIEQFLATAESGGLSPAEARIARKWIVGAMADLERVPPEFADRLGRLGLLGGAGDVNIAARLGPAHVAGSGRLAPVKHQVVPLGKVDVASVSKVGTGLATPDTVERAGTGEAVEVGSAAYYEVMLQIAEFHEKRDGDRLKEAVRLGEELLPKATDLGDRYAGLVSGLLRCYLALGELDRAGKFCEEVRKDDPELAERLRLEEILKEMSAASASPSKAGATDQ